MTTTCPRCKAKVRIIARPPQPQRHLEHHYHPEPGPLNPTCKLCPGSGMSVHPYGQAQ